MYKLISQANPFMDSILEVVCKNRGVDIDLILNHENVQITSAYELNNIKKAVECFKKHKDKTIGIVVDPDPDGYTSAAKLYMYIKKNFKKAKLKVFFQSGKEHGLTTKVLFEILESDIDLLFVPDSGSNDFEQHEILSHFNIPFIVLDHHEVKKESEYGIIVNSQLSENYSNKQLSGVGIVYNFLKVLDEEFNLNDADSYLDLVSLGNIADAMSMTSPETRKLVYKGFKQINNEWLKEMIYKNIGSYSKLSPTSYSFNLIPKMNAIIRVGTMEQKQELFYAIVGKQEKFFNNRTKKEESLQYKVTRESINVHKKQGKIKKEMVNKIKTIVEEKNLDKNSIIFVTVDKDQEFDKNLTGNIAQSISDFYKKPTFILHEKENKEEGKDIIQYSGSYRGVDNIEKNTKKVLESLDIFNYVEGHPQAGGVSVDKDKVEEAIKKINKVLDKKDKQLLIPVDFKIEAKKINVKLLEELQKLEKHWGKGIEQPLFYVENIKLDTNKIKISDGGMIKFNYSGIDYVQFVADKRFKEYENNNKELTINAICKLSINEFMGKTSYQALMEEFEIAKEEEIKKVSGFIW